MRYKVIIKGTSHEEIVDANSELEAKYKFCEKNKLSYNYFAGKLEAREQSDNK